MNLHCRIERLLVYSGGLSVNGLSKRHNSRKNDTSAGLPACCYLERGFVVCRRGDRAADGHYYYVSDAHESADCHRKDVLRTGDQYERCSGLM
jgi:hypothetical protein